MSLRYIKSLISARIKTRIKESLGVPSQEKSLRKLKSLGFYPETILDIGAYEGYWSKDFKKIFPNSKILMIEGQRSKEKKLQRLSADVSGVDYKIALLGSSGKIVDFNIYDTASSVLQENNDTCAITEQRMLTCLDELVLDTRYEKPDFIKIDTQGYELEVLKGGEKTLSHTMAVLLEVSMLDIYKESPLVSDVLEFMAKRGFVLYDICSLIYRPLDTALYQSDFLFVNKNSTLRNNKKWS